MLVGGGLYAVLYPWLKASVIEIGALGKITLPQLIGVSHWVVIPVMILLFIGAFRMFEKRGI
jgi:hypothetical protein